METFIDRYINQGLQQGEKRSFTRQLKTRFGQLPQWAQDRIRLADLKTVENWSIRLLSADNLRRAERLVRSLREIT
ncbi:MAG: DUF4351 domain-containing protein [Desulfococcaceae bacterium]|jgi:hypothetical protein|nr:DUF4351 domain-containing protein [Desulfococcaceae bacterium]